MLRVEVPTEHGRFFLVSFLVLPVCLTQAEMSGMTVPYDCRRGNCISCAARVQEGQRLYGDLNCIEIRHQYVRLVVATPQSRMIWPLSDVGNLYKLFIQGASLICAQWRLIGVV